MSEASKTKQESSGLGRAPSNVSQGVEDNTIAHDAVFGEITADGPNYRNVGWLGTSILMMKTQIGLGVLSIPSVFDTLGIVPGVIILCVVGGITTWSDFMVGIFKLRHPHVYGIDDAGFLMFGPIGREILGAGFCLFAAIIGFGFSSLRTLGRISWLAWIGVASIVIAVFTVTIAVGLQDRPAAAPQGVPWKSDYKIIGNPTFTEAIAAISSLVFSYAGTPAFFSIAAEMRDPQYYTRSLVLCQTVVTTVYITVGVVVYYYCGSYVSSPALGSAGPLVKKVAYGLGLPGLIVSAAVLLHSQLPSKHVFIRIMRGSKHLTANTFTHWATWIGCTFSVALVAYLVASGIPVFNSLISLIGALLGTLISFQPMGCMWLYDNWNKGRQSPTTRWYLMVAWSSFVILSGSFLMVAGTYSAVVSIIDDYNGSGGSAAWSCADNSNST
ncbi:hypothetical protein EsH8_II_001232 [Colletotrichum jinshuiense]